MRRNDRVPRKRQSLPSTCSRELYVIAGNFLGRKRETEKREKEREREREPRVFQERKDGEIAKTSERSIMCITELLCNKLS